MPDDHEIVLANDDGLLFQSEDYQREYLNTLSSAPRKYSLRNRDLPIPSTQNRTTQKKDTQPKQTSQASQNKEKEPVAMN